MIILRNFISKFSLRSFTFFLFLLVLSGGGFSCGNGSQPSSDVFPLFTDPLVKLDETASDTFTMELNQEAAALEPLVAKSGTHVSMGYWSGAGNHGSLVKLLDSVNAFHSPDGAAYRAIWDEGATSSIQYPAYVTMLDEAWYERSSEVEGVVTLRGIEYKDPFPVTFDQADQIWGQYSQRYADMAEEIDKETGNPVDTWCYIIGAKANRIFYKYEFPELQMLESHGFVRVHFAKSQDADWTHTEDWTVGTENAPTPSP